MTAALGRNGVVGGRPGRSVPVGHGRGFPEGGYVLGLHWYDSEALGVVLQLGLCMRLMVLDLGMEVREQVRRL